MTVDVAGRRLAIVGVGPGSAAWCTPEVQGLLESATDRVGYGTYLDLAAAIVVPTEDQLVHRSDNREEPDRARHALDLAAEGRAVVVVSSGDPGVFGMAAAVLEQLDGDHPSAWDEVELSVHPGVSAAHAAAARAGAPLGHDHCVVSLSDNLKPWSVVERRVRAAAEADFVLALYNPRSRYRPDQLRRALAIVQPHRDPGVPVVLGRDVGRPDERVTVVTLRDLVEGSAAERVDMRTVVIIGSSQTRVIPGGGAARPLVYTSRCYPDAAPGAGTPVGGPT